MGYYTRFELTWEDATGKAEEAFAQWRASNEDAAFVFDENHEAEESRKWYDWERHMAELSALCPDVLFTLSGEGEDAGDVWKAYFLGGRGYQEQAVVTIAEFDPAKLPEQNQGG